MLEIPKNLENPENLEMNECIQLSRQQEDNLQQEVQQKNQNVEKIGPNKVRFPYRSNDHECTLILEKKGNKIFVKLESIPTYMGRKMTNEYDDKAPNHQKQANQEKANLWNNGASFEANSSRDFLIKLGDILNIAISPKRVSAAYKGEQAYDLLFPQK